MDEDEPKKLYLVFTVSECGAMEGMFTEDGELLNFWSCEDARWSHDHFNGFMLQLGYTVSYPDTPQIARDLGNKIIKRCKAEWGE